jgi:hypothetical protein
LRFCGVKFIGQLIITWVKIEAMETKQAVSGLEEKRKRMDEQEPWWVKNPPETVVTGTRYYRGNNIYHDFLVIGNEEGEDDQVFVKLFDPEGKILGSDARRWQDLHKKWSEDAPWQRKIRKKYTDMFEPPNPILWSAESRNQDGFPAIIQEVAPKMSLYHLIGNEEISSNQRRRIFFNALEQYAGFMQVCFVIQENEKNIWKFFDQKGSDLRYEEDLGRLVILDLQRTGYWREDKYDPEGRMKRRQFPPGLAGLMGMGMEYGLLTEKEIDLCKSISSKFGEGVVTEKMNELINALIDFSRGELEHGDERVKKIVYEEDLKGDSQHKWDENYYQREGLALFSPIKHSLVMGMYVLEEAWAKEKMEEDLSKLMAISCEDDFQETIKGVLVIFFGKRGEIMGMNLRDDQKRELEIFNLALIGFDKLLAGEWEQERIPWEKEIKEALLDVIGVEAVGGLLRFEM